MSKLKYSLTLLLGLAIGGSGSYFYRNLINQRLIDENYQAGKNSGFSQGKEEGMIEAQPKLYTGDFDDDGLPDIYVELSNGNVYFMTDVNNDGMNDLILQKKDQEPKVYLGSSSKCSSPRSLDRSIIKD